MYCKPVSPASECFILFSIFQKRRRKCIRVLCACALNQVGVFNVPFAMDQLSDRQIKSSFSYSSQEPELLAVGGAPWETHNNSLAASTCRAICLKHSVVKKREY